jgi:dsDNA-binding SOS-regulon protein
MDQAQEKLLDGLEDLRKIGANSNFRLRIERIQEELLLTLEEQKNALLLTLEEQKEKLLLTLKEQKREIAQNSPRFDLAFYKINGALEDRFANLIKSHPNVSAEELTRIEYQHSRWVELTNSMQRHYGLSDADRSRIVSMNGYRSNCGYGSGFIRKYHDVEQYAQFVRNLMEKY